MPQYQVPQFIDVEDKVFGPLTIKQFLYLAAGAVVNVVIYNFFKGWVLFVLGVPVAIFVLALAFYKPSGVSFPRVVRSFFSYAFSKKLYLWKKREAAGSVLPANKEAFPETLPTVMQNPQHPLYVTPPKKSAAEKLQDNS